MTLSASAIWGAWLYWWLHDPKGGTLHPAVIKRRQAVAAAEKAARDAEEARRIEESVKVGQAEKEAKAFEYIDSLDAGERRALAGEVAGKYGSVHGTKINLIQKKVSRLSSAEELKRSPYVLGYLINRMFPYMKGNS